MKLVFKTEIIRNHCDGLAILRLISKAPLCKGSSAAGGEGLYYFELLFLQPLRHALRATSPCTVGGLMEFVFKTEIICYHCDKFGIGGLDKFDLF